MGPDLPENHNHEMSFEKHCRILEDRFKTFIEDTVDGFYETDLEGTFFFVNNAFGTIFGYPPEEMIGHNFREFMDDRNAAIAFGHFNRVYRTGKEKSDILWEIRRKDAGHRILELSINVIRNDDGNVWGFRGIVRDVTEKVTIQRALEISENRIKELYEVSRKAEKRHRALLKFLPVPVFVFNLDGTVEYVNPAFEEVFGWTLEEVKDRHVPFVPDYLRQETRAGFHKLMKEGIATNVETKRLTKDGKELDIILDGSVFYEDGEEPAGQVAILRDVTRAKRAEKTNLLLNNIASALPQYRRLDDLLRYIVREIKEIIPAEGGIVILVDEEKREFFFRIATFDDAETGRKMKEIRYPLNKGVAGYVYMNQRPVIIHNTNDSPLFYKKVDQIVGYETKNMIEVPIRTTERTIGVLGAVNKKTGAFDKNDEELLGAIASMAALPLENARINEELNQSYEAVKSMNRAKERVLHHLSHELKTPVSVLGASLKLLFRKPAIKDDPESISIIRRAQRNLDRLLEMQYGIEDILRQRDYRSYHMLTSLLEACTDELESLVAEETGEGQIVKRIRNKIEDMFGPRESKPETVLLDQFVEKKLTELQPLFSHRQCHIITNISDTSPIFIPTDSLSKIVEGLLRNAVENTPDKGRIAITVRERKEGPELEIMDYGVGITDENRKLMFESHVSTRDTMQYSSKKPYDFNAGGKGFDLLRMKIFSDRYRFHIALHSKRCIYIPTDRDVCPGDIDKCEHCQKETDCIDSGGTSVNVRFYRHQGSES